MMKIPFLTKMKIKVLTYLNKRFPKKVKGREIQVPLFIPTTPEIRLSEIHARRFFIVDRDQLREKDKAVTEEYRKMLKPLTHMTERDLIQMRHAQKVAWEMTRGPDRRTTQPICG